ncbi:MAG: hypothetical protein Q8K36_00140, partial [Alphaproteobacteria bacterium]|nr:hypothetical protein [Alphaproteobacteria bacterium]
RAPNKVVAIILNHTVQEALCNATFHLVGLHLISKIPHTNCGDPFTRYLALCFWSKSAFLSLMAIDSKIPGTEHNILTQYVAPCLATGMYVGHMYCLGLLVLSAGSYFMMC